MPLTRFPALNHVHPARFSFGRLLQCGLLTLALSSTTQAAQPASSIDSDNYTHAEMCFQLAQTSVFNQRYDREAISHCNRALRFDNLSAENRSRTYINRGVLLKNMARIRYAEGDFRRAQRDMRPNGDIEINLGNMSYLRGEFEQAAKRYSKALAMGVDAPYKAYLNRGLAYERMGNHDAAVHDYQQALQYNPDLQPAREQLLGMMQTRNIAGNDLQRQQQLLQLLQPSIASLH